MHRCGTARPARAHHACENSSGKRVPQRAQRHATKRALASRCQRSTEHPLYAGVPVRPERGNPAVETTAEQDRIDPIDRSPQPALAWNAMMELGETPQEGEMVFAPGDDVVEIVARSDSRASHQQQDLLEGIHDPPGLAVIPEFGAMVQQQAQPRPRDFFVYDRVCKGFHDYPPPESKPSI